MKIHRFGQDRINDTLARLKDLVEEDFDLEVFDFLYEKENLGESLDQTQRQILATYILDIEVCNGGFDQFYLNNQLTYIDAAIEGLENIDATQYADLAKESKWIYLRDAGKFDDKRNPAFTDLDDQYYEIGTLIAKRTKFIKQNLNNIIADK